MRAHALALLVVVGLALPAAPVQGALAGSHGVPEHRLGALAGSHAVPGDRLGALADSTTSAWDQAQRLVERGDYTQAEQLYASLADQAGPEVAPRALLLQARAQLAAGDTDAAEATLQQLLTDYPRSGEIPGAYFTLEQERRAAGDCAGALRALAAYEQAAGPAAIGPYAQLQRAQCAARLADWQGELRAAQAALQIEGGGPRLAQIEALERAAEANLKLGQQQAALGLYNRGLDLAGTRAYRAEMLFTTASLARGLGQTDLARERFRSVVVDYADQARAPAALDALSDMQHADTISPYQAGLVRLNARDYSAAIDAFEEVDSSSPEWGLAQLGRAEALGKLGRDAAAHQALAAVAEGDPSQAGSALLRLGQLQERDGDLVAAEQSYLGMAQAAPERTAEALFHVGFVRYVGGDREAAADAWRTALGSGPPPPALQAQLWYWLGKALPAGSTEAAEAVDQAAASAPQSYYGLRAREIKIPPLPEIGRGGQGGSLCADAPLERPCSAASQGRPSEAERQERDAWLATQGTTAQRVASDLAALPGLKRADQLLELGLRTEASWEIDAISRRYGQDRDLAHLSGLADWLSARGLPQLTLQVGKLERDLVGSDNLATLPRAVQKQVYPDGFVDLVVEQAGRYNLDPLLLLALIRQESSFDPRARSGAQAMGLTQVVPATAQMIAARLGETDFEPGDLLKPRVSVEFGAWFLAQLMGSYHGQLFPSLAAYNAGQGNVGRWLARFGDDPDVLVEQIPLVETQTYLRVVYENYWHYRDLYGT